MGKKNEFVLLKREGSFQLHPESSSLSIVPFEERGNFIKRVSSKSSLVKELSKIFPADSFSLEFDKKASRRKEGQHIFNFKLERRAE